MDREYIKWYSPALQKDMELLVFGRGGASIIFFPPRMGRFYDYENWGVMESLRSKIEKGYIQVFCVDSDDCQSFYNYWLHPAQKVQREIQYEKYIVNEVVPLVRSKNPGGFMIAAGCSLGAYHAMNIGLRNSWVFNKLVGMSGRYDITVQIGHYDNLLGGYWDENVYFNMPPQYISNLTDPSILNRLKQIEIVLAIGQDDILLDSNRLFNYKLTEKGARSYMHVWDQEAHRARYWRQMVNNYL
ncbi:MAG: esterase family protein [Bacteroidetes bacterium]|jgi:esterase/lipase superfamily enzyme|nr:esterase family protein [Bacteroidota bacterium]